MASKNGRKAKKALKKFHPAYIVIGVVALVVGLAVGYFGASFIAGDDTLEVKGSVITYVKDGETVTYKDEGIKYISNGKDLSSKYKVTSTNMGVDGDGNYFGIPTEDQELYIIYTVTDGRAADQTVYRVFRVGTPEGGEA